MSILARARLELTKQYWETKQSWVAFVVSTLVMLGLFLLVRDTASFQYLTSSQGRGGGLWIYCLWVFCTTASLDVSKSICADIGFGTLANFAQGRNGLRQLTDGRFLSSSLFALLIVAVIAMALFALGGRFPRLEALDTLIVLALLLQTYALTLFMVAIGLRQKNEIAANFVGLVISIPIVLLPVEKFLGGFAALFPVAGPLSLLRTGSSPVDLIVLCAATAAWVFFARLIFAKVEKGLKMNGSLLFR